MDEARNETGWFDRWILWTLAIWLGAAVYMIVDRWGAIHWFSLPDTDDNMRMAQVRAWLNGQGWFDLRQYKLDPPRGANIHWSRLVDLPIAAIIEIVRPLFGGKIAEQAAAAIAPLLPLSVALGAAALTARRLVAANAFLLACGLLLCCQIALYMFTPMRIDHHGWQLALLLVTITGLADAKGPRGGATAGIASALSIAIGLEMLPYLGLAGVAIGARWAWDRGEAPRLRAYAAALAGGVALGYALFASYDNRQVMCDALSPVWLSTLLAASALLALLTMIPIESRVARLLASAVAGGVVAGFFVTVWPGCLGRPEHISPELQRVWLDNVREARPIYRHGASVMLGTMALPVVGLIGAVFATWYARRDPRLAAWLSILTLSIASVAMLFWQARAGPAAQVIGVAGSAALGWWLLVTVARSRHMLVRVFGAVGVFLLVSGLFTYPALPFLPKDKDTPRTKAINRAGRICPTLPALRPIAKLPAATIMTFADLGPRLITVTHHRAIAGPYHRNGDAILDLHHAFAGTPDAARAIAVKHNATLLLICPNFAESTLYQSRAPNGFYAQLAKGKRFDWLTPMPLPKKSPFRLWRIEP